MSTTVIWRRSPTSGEGLLSGVWGRDDASGSMRSTRHATGSPHSEQNLLRGESSNPQASHRMRWDNILDSAVSNGRR